MAGSSGGRLRKMKVRNWREKCTDRGWWNKIVEQAKPTKGCSAVRRRRRRRMKE
jgi:hypothetical protein